MAKRGTLITVEKSIEFNGSKCQTYVKDDESYYSSRGGMRMARFHLTGAAGAPKPGDVCRHKCSNDSNLAPRPGGFVCCNPDHLQWGTQQENMADRTPEAKAAGGNLQRTCIHCKKTTNAGNHGRYHGDRCKDKLISALIIDDSDGQLNLIYDS